MIQSERWEVRRIRDSWFVEHMALGLEKECPTMSRVLSCDAFASSRS